MVTWFAGEAMGECMVVGWLEFRSMAGVATPQQRWRRVPPVKGAYLNLDSAWPPSGSEVIVIREQANTMIVLDLPRFVEKKARAPR